MRVFFGGQIKREHRGDIAVVINREKKADILSSVYDVFVEKVNSDEFNYLTGTRAVVAPIDRVYIGITNSLGNEIARRVNNVTAEMINLRSIDDMVVVPYFLDKSLEKPQEIVLESTRDGYRIK